ncbi:MAG: hypothetical protein HUK21_00405 [Fibrobacteraceae bacterium]|nr:hypothetical protein [Fibrobacteraceae bacterium]
MFINPKEKLRDVKIVNEKEKNDIKNFLQGAVYYWCKNRKNERFSLQSLMGGENFYWEGTPLIRLYEERKKICAKTAIKEAAKAAGWLLKTVLAKDKRKFDSKIEARNKSYWCVDLKNSSEQ